MAKTDVFKNRIIGYGTKPADQFKAKQKPTSVFAWIYERYTDVGAIIADPYVGSGTTIIACEQLGRKCRAVELHPPYVAVALQRWADMTGKTPIKLS